MNRIRLISSKARFVHSSARRPAASSLLASNGMKICAGLVATALILSSPTQIRSEAKKPKVVAAPPVKTESPAGVEGSATERTFIALKPDGTQRGLLGEVVNRFERKGYRLVAIKSIVPQRSLAEEHYADLSSRPFFKGLVDYMTSGKAPVIAMVWEGKDVIRQGRRLIGATNPLDATPGTIRGDFCISVGRNIIHGSDSFESADKEIGLWFSSAELSVWQYGNAEWLYAEN